jgi:hypothetical protein
LVDGLLKLKSTKTFYFKFRLRQQWKEETIQRDKTPGTAVVEGAEATEEALVAEVEAVEATMATEATEIEIVKEATTKVVTVETPEETTTIEDLNQATMMVAAMVTDSPASHPNRLLPCPEIQRRLKFKKRPS